MDRFNKLKDWQKVLAGVCVVIIAVALFTHYQKDTRHHENYMDYEAHTGSIDAERGKHISNTDVLDANDDEDKYWDKGFASEDIEHFTDQGTGCFTMFYAPWCGHCKNTLPTWQEFKEQNQMPVVVNEVNCDDEPELGKLHNVQGYPTIKYLPGGINDPNGAIEFNGARTAQGFMNFLQENVSGDPSELPDNAKFLNLPRGGAPPPNRAGNPVPTTSYVGRHFDME